MNMTRGRWHVSAAVGIAVIWAPYALGQAGVSTTSRTSDYSQWGGAETQARGSVDLGVSVNAGDLEVRPHAGVWAVYDDNVNLDREGEVDDIYVSFAPGVMMLYGNPEQNYIVFDYTLEAVRYDEQTDLDYESHSGSADAHYEMSKTTFHVADRYVDKRVTDSEVGEDVRKTHNAATLDVERLISSKTSAGVNGMWEFHDYERRDYVDYDEYRAGGRFYYRVHPKTDVFADAGYGWVDLRPLPADVNRDLSERLDKPIDDSYGDAEYLEMGGGVRGQVGRKSQASGRVAYQQRDFENDSIEGLEEWVMSMSYITKFTARFQGGVEVSRRIVPWTTRPGNSAVSTSVNPFVRRQLWRNRVSVSASMRYDNAEYYETDGRKSREDETWSFSGLIDWKALDYLTLGGGYGYTKVDSSENESDAERNTVIARAMWNY